METIALSNAWGIFVEGMSILLLNNSALLKYSTLWPVGTTARGRAVLSEALFPIQADVGSGRDAPVSRGASGGPGMNHIRHGIDFDSSSARDGLGRGDLWGGIQK